MQEDKVLEFKKVVGELVRELRKKNTNLSINKFALSYDFDKSNMSKLERGIYSAYLITAWRLSEALGLKFSEFAKLIEEKLGEDFTLMDI